MNIPEDLYYTSEHEWVAIHDNTATIGITDYAQSELGDIVFVECADSIQLVRVRHDLAGLAQFLVASQRR